MLGASKCPPAAKAYGEAPDPEGLRTARGPPRFLFQIDRWFQWHVPSTSERRLFYALLGFDRTLLLVIAPPCWHRRPTSPLNDALVSDIELEWELEHRIAHLPPDPSSPDLLQIPNFAWKVSRRSVPQTVPRDGICTAISWRRVANSCAMRRSRGVAPIHSCVDPDTNDPGTRLLPGDEIGSSNFRSRRSLHWSYGRALCLE
ncbi:hypothetical protein F5Y15DRAFT_269499 [Xylariaceae sp. FL0016]|nr:hypothetical protein F5Y15DRAFT_269499 [Xylariaceae sp. FL0016]